MGKRRKGEEKKEERGKGEGRKEKKEKGRKERRNIRKLRRGSLICGSGDFVTGKDMGSRKQEAGSEM